MLETCQEICATGTGTFVFLVRENICGQNISYIFTNDRCATEHTESLTPVSLHLYKGYVLYVCVKIYHWHQFEISH